jgi:hypothetical protein
MEQIAKTFNPQNTDKTIERITVQLLVQDCQGTVHVTDIMFQGGSVATPWVGHPSEIKWSFDSV